MSFASGAFPTRHHTFGFGRFPSHTHSCPRCCGTWCCTMGLPAGISSSAPLPCGLCSPLVSCSSWRCVDASACVRVEVWFVFVVVCVLSAHPLSSPLSPFAFLPLFSCSCPCSCSCVMMFRGCRRSCTHCVCIGWSSKTSSMTAMATSLRRSILNACSRVWMRKTSCFSTATGPPTHLSSRHFFFFFVSPLFFFLFSFCVCVCVS